MATGILAAVLPLMVVTGMHKAMIPYAVSSMSEMGAELLYLPASLAHNIAEAGACFAVSVRTKDQNFVQPLFLQASPPFWHHRACFVWGDDPA